jgi:phospholipase/carboxylesterase
MNPPAPHLERIELTTGDAPQATVIWLHGLGADGNDFVPIVPELGLDEAGCGALRFVFPHAPVIPVTINGGYRMRAWYDILGADLARREDLAGLQASQQAIAALIDQEIARGIPASRIVLAGFSQGCAMSLLTGLRYPHRLAGIVGLSGYLPLADSTAAQADAANRGVPVLMAHGRLDPVVPLTRGQAARDMLTALGYPVEWHEYPMEHSVCPDEIDAVAAFIKRVLPRLTPA